MHNTDTHLSLLLDTYHHVQREHKNQNGHARVEKRSGRKLFVVVICRHRSSSFRRMEESKIGKRISFHFLGTNEQEISNTLKKVTGKSTYLENVLYPYTV